MWLLHLLNRVVAALWKLSSFCMHILLCFKSLWTPSRGMGPYYSRGDCIIGKTQGYLSPCLADITIPPSLVYRLTIFLNEEHPPQQSKPLKNIMPKK